MYIHVYMYALSALVEHLAFSFLDPIEHVWFRGAKSKSTKLHKR